MKKLISSLLFLLSLVGFNAFGEMDLATMIHLYTTGKTGVEPAKFDMYFNMFSNAKKEEALLESAYHGWEKAVDYILSKGVNKDAKDDMYGETALMKAASVGKDKVVKLLLDKGASVDLKNDLKDTALLIAITHAVGSKKDWQEGFRNTVKYLLDKNADPNIPGDLGLTPLEYLVQGKKDKDLGQAFKEELVNMLREASKKFIAG